MQADVHQVTQDVNPLSLTLERSSGVKAVGR